MRVVLNYAGTQKKAGANCDAVAAAVRAIFNGEDQPRKAIHASSQRENASSTTVSREAEIVGRQLKSGYRESTSAGCLAEIAAKETRENINARYWAKGGCITKSYPVHKLLQHTVK